MNSEGPTGTAPGNGNGPWFATFMFLDAGCAISSSQLAGIVASLTRGWRRAVGRLFRSGVRIDP